MTCEVGPSREAIQPRHWPCPTLSPAISSPVQPIGDLDDAGVSPGEELKALFTIVII